MEKQKTYWRTHFSADVVTEAERAFRGILPEGEEVRPNFRQLRRGAEQWNFDSDEEFFAEYRIAGGDDSSLYDKYVVKHIGSYQFRVLAEYGSTTVTVKAPSRPQIETVLEVFERHASASLLDDPPSPAPQLPTVFIGHGRDQQWRDLKDHLHEQHGYPVEAYEVGARAGHVIRDILEGSCSAAGGWLTGVAA